MSTPSVSTFTTPGPTSALSAERERHRAVFASTGDEMSRKRFALPDPASPDYKASLQGLEGEIDRAIAAMDRQDKAEDRAEANRQAAQSEGDPAPLSDYKRAEAIKQNTPS